MSKVRDINLAVIPTARSKLSHTEQKDDVLRRISLVYVKKGAIFCLFRVSHLLNVNPLQPGAVYLYPLKTSENLKGFLMFSGGIDKQHQAVMG